jgi:glucose-6-phosphate isomerase
MGDADWGKLEQIAPQSLPSIFADEPDRVAAMTIEQSGIRFDFAKTHLTPDILSLRLPI